MYQEKHDTNILIVDDTPDEILIASSILKELGYPIRVANNGASALKLIEQRIPTLILLDIQMPDLNGFELCRHIKKNPHYHDVAIIFMTVSKDEKSISKGFFYGAQDYVTKPYTASELIARVNAHLKIAIQSNALKASYQGLDQFCHTVSHDLKSPLQVIKQLAALLDTEFQDTSSPDAKEIIERLMAKSDDVILMIERLLEFSKMTQMGCHFSILDLKHIFSETLNELLILEGGRNISYYCDEIPPIHGDVTLLKLLAQNILGNSLKFSRKRDSPKIRIQYNQEEQWHVISIKDNGVGFDQNYANKLFRVFERLHSKEEFEGSGVGLAIVERIMVRHGGKVAIAGTVNHGATVTLFFKKLGDSSIKS